MTPPVVVRAETAADRAGVRRVNELAFEGAAEADLVEALHRDGLVLSSLVAEIDGAVEGHILFSRMWVDWLPAARWTPSAWRLSPWRRRISVAASAACWSAAASTRCASWASAWSSSSAIPDYYPRFGFERAGRHGMTGPFPAEAFMARELAPGALRRRHRLGTISGRIRHLIRSGACGL